MYKLIVISFVLFSITGTYGQNNQIKMNSANLIGGPCEGCEAVFEYGEKQLTAVDTLPDFDKAQKKLKLLGTIYRENGKTPAQDIILYIYHANKNGEYAPGKDAKGWEKRHGYLRGWIKTDKSGKYTFYTQKPGAYGSNLPHIHATILEPDGNYYWISAYKFPEDDSVTERKRAKAKLNDKRGSLGIMTFKEEDNFLVAERDIILGLNVPGYE